MTWEATSALASIITAVVIAVTAAAALIQIRHLRAANQLTAAVALYGDADGPELRKARTFCAIELVERMKDPAFCDELLTGKIDRERHLELQVGNYWERIGLLMRRGLIERDLFLDYFATPCVESWHQLREVPALVRRGGRLMWRDFEYIAGLAEAHLEKMRKAPLKLKTPPTAASKPNSS